MSNENVHPHFNGLLNSILPDRVYSPITYTLRQAMAKIEANLNRGCIITGIQFEDGSGYKFNVQIDGGKWEFVNLHDL